MKSYTTLSLRRILWLSIIVLFFSSCVPQKKMLYLQIKDAADTMTVFYNAKSIEYRMQPGDNLYIRVVSLDEKTTVLLNPSGASNYMNTDASIYLNSYAIDERGYLDFPLTGKIYVKNMTVEEVKVRLEEELKVYLKEFVVIVRLVNFNITILGEVNRPGPYKVYQNRINIFEAISMAGDMTDFANREKVAIIRQTKVGSKVLYLDMTKRGILESDYFYLRPNDIVYVIPVKGKQFTFAAFPYAVIFSAISTAFLVVNYFQTSN
jgi:polysaccharide export outer membrane protein